MRRHRRRSMLVLAAVTGLLLGLPATTATAATGVATGPDDDAWVTTVTCATGAFTGESVEPDGDGRPVVWMEGWIQPCADIGPVDQFGVIYYTRGPGRRGLRGHVFPVRLREYVGGSGRTGFKGTVDPKVAERYGDLVGLCIAYDDRGLVACELPKSAAADGTKLPSMATLRRVCVTQRFEGDLGGEPSCGTCL